MTEGLVLKQNFYNQLQVLVKAENLKIKESLAEHTSFRIGGPADYFVIPETAQEIKNVIKLCKKEEVSFYIIGNGSNLLVGDYGYHGVIIQILNKLSYIEFQDNGRVKAGAGVLLSKLSVEVGQKGLTGFEFAAGIPGTLGGAVTMNAGAYDGEIKDCIVSALVMDQEGNDFWLTKEELQLGYRTSLVQKKSLIVLEAIFEFERGVIGDILNQISELNARRREKQPLELPSVGSTFKRPKGYFAGQLIMEAGLRGYRVGNIMISDKHCGFVVNIGNGTAKQARELIKEVDSIVYEKFGVHLEPEVRFLGEF
jgi:UDP-N-acetylmuramate dehydrogenase